jgi:hypothetical protein
LVPSPVLTWPDPSAIMQIGPTVQASVGAIGASVGPVEVAGK